MPAATVASSPMVTVGGAVDRGEEHVDWLVQAGVRARGWATDAAGLGGDGLQVEGEIEGAGLHSVDGSAEACGPRIERLRS